MAAGEQVGDGQAVGDDLHGAADEQPRDFERGGAAVEQNRIPVANTGRGRPGDQALLGDLARGAVLQRGQHRAFTHKHGSAMDALDQSLVVPVIQVAPQSRFRDLHCFRQIRKGDESPLGDQIQHVSPAFLHKHRQYLRDIDGLLDNL